MEIIDPRDYKTYNIKELRVVFHDIPNDDGEVESVKCVEYNVLGQSHEWDFWMLYKDLMKANEEVALSLAE